MAPPRAYVSLFPNSVLDVDLWRRFYNDEEITADVPPPVKASPTMAGSTSSVSLSVSDQQQAIAYILDQSIESILHDILLDIHQEEKIARMQTAVVELEQRAEKLGKKMPQPQDHNNTNEDKNDAENTSDEVETNAAFLKAGQIQLKGNPMDTLKHIRCPNCRLRRLQYPRVGFNSRPVPDATEQYCKTEPMIILDKHDVHGQRKKGVKVKGQAKGKNKKKATTTDNPTSPASENSDPLTPASGNPAGDAFEFKEIDYPAAKCPNRESHLGDHWKSVNVFATHLNGSCYLKKDRAAGREANAKIGGNTPRDSRASSPKGAAGAGTNTSGATSNGVKRKAEDDSGNSSPIMTKKKQKTGETRKLDKKAGGTGPSKLRETKNVNDDDRGPDESPLKEINDRNGDTIQVTPTKASSSSARDASSEPTLKIKLKTGADGAPARKKPKKMGKKAQ